jgi:HSP20 family molecular chaperone IbpA
MTRNGGFGPLIVSFDRPGRGSGDGYPPCNIEDVGDGRLRVTLAVAGFAPDDLDVKVAGDQLVVQGRRRDDEVGRQFLHRGIAARSFRRAFLLADGIEVAGATLDHGLLTIDLARPVEAPSARSIPINATNETTRPLAKLRQA